MDLLVRSFRLQKAGNLFEECEDKSYPKCLNKKQEVRRIAAQHRFAFGIADGATESMLSREWAEILVKAFCRSRDSQMDIRFVVEKASEDWSFWIKDYIAKRERRNKPIKWYEEPGLKAGSFSTLLGLVFVDLDGFTGGTWQALAVGDSCLFHIRDGSLIQDFPIESSSAFGNRPSLIASNPARNRNLIESCNVTSGEWLAHDRFYLMTDALACRFMQESDAGNSPWLSYPFVNDNKAADFEIWVDGLRMAKKMKNDDVTLIAIEVAK